MKAVIRIRLIPRIDAVASVLCRETIRGDGPDTWEVMLTMTTCENHVATYCFTSENKTTALLNAYDCLKKHTIYVWFPDFYKQEWEKYREILETVDNAATRFNESMAKVECGERTKEEHLEAWEARMSFLQKKGTILPPPDNKEHVLTNTMLLPRFSEHMSLSDRIKRVDEMVELGTISDYQRRKWWKTQYTGECPAPQKWHWTYWFWNPEGVKK